MSDDKLRNEVRKLAQSRGDAGKLSHAELDQVAQQLIGEAVDQVSAAVNEGSVPFNPFSGLALLFVGARCLRDLGWSEDQALGMVAHAYEQGRLAPADARALPN